MDMNTFVEIMKVAAPVISSALTVIGGLIAIVKAIKSIKSENDADRLAVAERLANLEKKIGETNTKVKSIEKHLIEKKERR